LSSLSFGRNVFDLAELEEAVAQYATRACEKLRRDCSVTSEVQVSVRTSAYSENNFSDSHVIALPYATDDNAAGKNGNPGASCYLPKRIYISESRGFLR